MKKLHQLWFYFRTRKVSSTSLVWYFCSSATFYTSSMDYSCHSSTRTSFRCQGRHIITNRVYCWYLHWKIGKDNIRWFAIVKDVNEMEHSTLFMMARFVFVELYMTAALMFFSMHVLKLAFERSLPLDIIFNSTVFVMDLGIIRLASSDVPLFYMMATCCYMRARKQFSEFNSSFASIDGEIHRTVFSRILSEYKSLLATISDVNSMVKFLMIEINLFIVPFFGSVIVIAVARTDNWVQQLMKVIILIPASLYAVRGIILTSILAQL